MGSNSSITRRNQDSVDQSRPHRKLPPEIIDSIFTIAAHSSRESAFEISFVSRDSRTVTIPALFESLTLERRSATFTLAEMLRTSPKIASVVRALWMRECTPKDVEIFTLCTGLERLAVTAQAFSALCRFGNSIQRVHGRDAIKLAPLKQLLLFPGTVDWDIKGYDSSAAAMHAPYSSTILTSLTHLYLTQASQLLRLYTTPLALSALSHLATPLAGTNLSPLDIIESYRFPKLKRMLVLPRPRNDPGLSPRCQFAATQWDAEGLAAEFENDERVKFSRGGTVTDAWMLDIWKDNWGRLWGQIE